jgi:hypothetical protein
MSGKLLSAFFVTASYLLSGCAAPLLLTAGAAGAGAGYVATQEKPRNQFEIFFNDLGRSIRHTTRRISAGLPGRRPTTYREPTNRHPVASAPRSGFGLKIQRSTLAPTEVHKGEQVTLTLQYMIMGASEKGVTIREKSSLNREGKELTVLKEESSEKENGTWENTLSFAVPEGAQPGKYTVTLLITAQGQTRSTRRSFTVR